MLLSLEEKLIDDEEFAVLYEEFTPKNLPFCHWDYEKLSHENKDPTECKADFRFQKSDISLLVDVLQMPDTFTCPNGTVCDSTKGLCVILKGFSYPCKLSDMISTFGRSVPELSMINNKVTEWMYNVHGHRITEWNHFIMSPNLLQTYSEAIHDKGAAWKTVSALLMERFVPYQNQESIRELFTMATSAFTPLNLSPWPYQMDCFAICLDQ